MAGGCVVVIFDARCSVGEISVAFLEELYRSRILVITFEYGR
jgi:hypothetical protein